MKKYKAYLLWASLLLAPMAVSGQLSIQALTPRVFHLSDKANGSSMKAALVRDGTDAVLIDTMMDSLATHIHSFISEESLTLQLIINTHYHGDHVGGNDLYDDVHIAAHDNTLLNIQEKAPYGPPETFGLEAHPNMLFSDKLTYYLHDVPIHLIHYQTAHTTGDAVVYLPTENVIIVGDIMLDAINTLPFCIDPNGTIKVLTAVSAAMDGNTQVVTGHGQIAHRQHVEALIGIMKETMAYVRSGGDIENYPSRWRQWDSDFLTMDAWLLMLQQQGD